jgi:DNA-binding transcriptional ArsR family regulator
MARSSTPAATGAADPTACGCPPPAPTPRMPRDAASQDATLASLAKALGHPARVAIVRLLLRRDGCVCGEIVDELPLAQSTVSQHLNQLKKAGLIRGRIDGPRTCYCVEPGSIVLLQSLVAALSPLVPPPVQDCT